MIGKTLYIIVIYTSVGRTYLQTEIAAFSSKKKANRWAEKIETEMATLDNLLWIKDTTEYRKATRDEMKKHAPTMFRVGMNYNPNIIEIIVVDVKRF